jgi:hypothetical protein
VQWIEGLLPNSEKTLDNQEKASKKEAFEADKTRRAEALKAEQDLLKQKNDIINKIKKADLDYTDTLLTEQEKEKVIVARKYEELYAEAIKFKLDTTKLKENETAELAKIEKKYIDASRAKLDALTLTEEQKLKKQLEIDLKAAEENAELKLAIQVDYDKKIDVLEKAKQDKINSEKQKLHELTLSESQLRLQKLTDQYAVDQLLYKDNKEILKALDEKYAKDKENLENEELARKRETTKKGIDMAMSALSILNDAFQMSAGKSEKDQRKAFKAQKAFNLASALTNTYLAVTGALTAGGNPIKLATGMQFVEAGIAAAAGAVQIAKIAGTQFDSGGSSTSGGGGGASAPTMSAPQFNVVGQSGLNQLASLNQQPVQAYVVSGQVTSQQALDRNRLENATLGG